jgi:DNA-binding response OmpR family regulator
VFFSLPELRHTTDLIVYGPPHLFRAAWLGGVVDYLREPWQPEELFLRLRGPLPSRVEWVWQDRKVRLEGLVLALDDLRTKLSPTEADLLKILVQRRGMAVSRAVLGWAASCSAGRVVDTLVARVRRKLQGLAATEEDPIVAVRGLGYRLP